MLSRVMNTCREHVTARCALVAAGIKADRAGTMLTSDVRSPDVLDRDQHMQGAAQQLPPDTNCATASGSVGRSPEAGVGPLHAVVGSP